MADLVHRRVAVIAPGSPWCPGGQSGNHDDPDRLRRRPDPVKLGLVASLARPGGNATGINFFC